MELKEHIFIFKKNIKIFFLAIIIILIISALTRFFWPEIFSSSLVLNITRSGFQETSDYTYDSFYRLQADERFAHTVVNWLSSPRIVIDIYNDANVSLTKMKKWKIRKIFKVRQLSSQAIQVNYSAPDVKTAQKISLSINKILNEEIAKLNQFQKEKNWFILLTGEPVIEKSAPEWKFVILFSFVFGIFIGIWAVYIKHYLS